MPKSIPAPVMLPDFGARLRRLRRLRGLKQGALAELARVCQTTVSRWERGLIVPDPPTAARVLSQLAGASCDLADGPLRRLIENANEAVHLIADDDHRLLAASPARAAEWRRSVAELRSVSLWRFATPEIQTEEGKLAAAGWWRADPSAQIRFETRSADNGLPILAGTMTWEKLFLADGTPVRLCTTLA